jgi:hypothetical protein
MSRPPNINQMKNYKVWVGKPWHWCCPETGGLCEGVWRVYTQNTCKGKSFKGHHGEAKAETPKKSENDINLNLMKLYAVIREAGLQVSDS